MKLNRILY